MNVDKFGLHINKKQKRYMQITECALKLTSDGNLNAQNKVLKNLHYPVDNCDSATKEYVDKSLADFMNKNKTVNDILKELMQRLYNLENKLSVKENKKK